jgi:hypothetical protein
VDVPNSPVRGNQALLRLADQVFKVSEWTVSPEGTLEKTPSRDSDSQGEAWWPVTPVAFDRE